MNVVKGIFGVLNVFLSYDLSLGLMAELHTARKTNVAVLLYFRLQYVRHWRWCAGIWILEAVQVEQRKEVSRCIQNMLKAMHPSSSLGLINALCCPGGCRLRSWKPG